MPISNVICWTIANVAPECTLQRSVPHWYDIGQLALKWIIAQSTLLPTMNRRQMWARSSQLRNCSPPLQSVQLSCCHSSRMCHAVHITFYCGVRPLTSVLMEMVTNQKKNSKPCFSTLRLNMFSSLHANYLTIPDNMCPMKNSKTEKSRWRRRRRKRQHFEIGPFSRYFAATT